MPNVKSAFLLVVLSLAACSHSTTDGLASGQDKGAHTISVDRQTAYRVRRDFDSSLNAEGGWAGGIDQPTLVTADQPFRIRFEVEAGDRPEPRVFSLQFRRNDGDWQALPAEDFPYPIKRIERTFPAPDREPMRDWTIVEGRATAPPRPEPSDQGLLIEASGLEDGGDTFRAWFGTEVDWRPNEFSLELRLPAAPGNEFGLIVEDRGADDYAYIALIPPDQAQLVRIDGERRRVIAETTTRIPSDQWFELKAELNGSKWITEIEGEMLFDFPETPARLEPRGTPRLGIRLQTGGRVVLRTLTIEGEASTPRTSIVSNPVLGDGAPTTDQLPGSVLPFGGGAGLSLTDRTAPWTAQRHHGEWEVPIVIRRFSDGAALNEQGDRFDFRLIDSDGRPLPASATASVRLAVPDGHLGGTFVETPMRLGPWQSRSGDLYFILEPSETWNRPMMVKSSDGGRSWREVDGPGRPKTGDLEGVASVYADGRIHVLHQVSEEVIYHAFDSSSAVDAWVVRDEHVDAPLPPPTQVADLAVRTDGSVVAVYGTERGLRYAIRSPGDGWSEGQDIAGPDGAVLSGPTVVLGRRDVVHLAYTASDGTAWVRRIDPAFGMSDPVQISDTLATGASDAGALLPLVTLNDGETVSLVYRTSSGQLVERRSSKPGVWSDPVIVTRRTVVQSAVDSDQVGADMIADGNTLHVLFIEAATGVLYHTVRKTGAWSEPEVVITDANVQWVRGQVVGLAERGRRYGFVYDGGSNGGSGRNQFFSIPLKSD